MDKEHLLSNHVRETARLGRVIDELTQATPTRATPILVAIIEDKIDLLRSLGIRLKAVAELEVKMEALKAEVQNGSFASKSDVKIKDLEFKEVVMGISVDACQWAHHGEFGSITILDRVTGYGDGWRDIETGFRSPDKKFWLASGGFDIRSFPDLTVSEAIEKIKENANTCLPT